jgi:uncharacterized SAM-binding protein YcdF (DUF218 family)
MKPMRCFGCLIVAFIAVVLLSSGLSSKVFLRAAGNWLDIGVRPQKADAVVLLNAGYNTRPFVAAALVHGGWAEKILLNTVALHPVQAAGAVPASHEIARSVLEYGGVSPDRVVLLQSSARTTFDEAKGVAAYLDSHPAKRLLLVTEGFHTRRSRWIFQRVLSGRNVEVLAISAPPEEIDAANWWRSKAGFLFVVSEYLKLPFYAIRYGWLGYELIAVVAGIFVMRAWFRRRRKLVLIGM